MSNLPIGRLQQDSFAEKRKILGTSPIEPGSADPGDARGYSVVPQPETALLPMERALIERSLAGDHDAFAELYAQHREAILATCLRRLRDRALAEDAMQDTFLRAYANLSAFDLARPMLPWLQAIAVRRCIDLARRSATASTAVALDDEALNGVEQDPTLRAVLAKDESARLEVALRRIAPRQRRALLLHAIEGWSYADIAAAEEISVASTKSLLFHARRNLRRACKRGLLGAILVPVAYARRRVADATGAMRVRFRAAASASIDVAGVSLGQTVAAITVAIAALAPQLAPAAAGSFANVASHSAAERPSQLGAKPSRERGTIAALGLRAAGVERLLHPTRNATPAQSQMTSIAASPDYENDHTLVASGRVACATTTCPVLFISHDGGATWQQRAASGFTGYDVLLPPDFPRDPRIFAMAPEGLEVSKNLGATFRVALPVQGEAAISPLFDAGDPRLLVANASVIEYWANQGLAKPALMVGPAGRWLTVEFSSTYQRDRTVFVGGVRPQNGAVRGAVYRCSGEICGATDLPSEIDAPWVRVSPRFAKDHLAYAFTSSALYRSTNGGGTFARLSTPFDRAHDVISDVLIDSPGAEGGILVAIQSSRAGHAGVYRSLDAGVTWTRTTIAPSGFRSGVRAIYQAPGGRLFALGLTRGVVCSDDVGSTWTTRCAAA